MQYLFMGLMVLGAVGIDQWTKLWIVENIRLGREMPVLDGIFHLTYTQNTGAAWSSFEGMIWLFALIFMLFTIGIIWEFKTKKLGLLPFEHWCVAAIFAGGLGNMIDRLRLGYVVDMIAVEFIDFPVFNVADCFITCGCLLLVFHLIFFNKAFWKDKE